MGLFARQIRKGASVAAEPHEESEAAERDRANRVTMAQLVDMLNLGGVPRDKLSEATYFICLKVLSEGVSKLPLKILRTTKEKGVEEAWDNPLYRMLRYRPNPLKSSTLFWCDMEMARNHWGNSYAMIHGSGKDTTLWQMGSDKVQVWHDNRRILADHPNLWYIWSAPDGKRYSLSREEVLHFRSWLSMDGVTGLSVQEILRANVEGIQHSQSMLNKLYQNGFTAKAVVQYTGDLSPELEKKFIAGLERYATGQMDTSKNFIPAPYGVKVEPLNIKLTDSQFIEVRKHSALQIAAAFGVKPNQINDYEKSSYANSENQQLAFLKDTLLWILKQYEEEMTYQLIDLQRQEAGEAAKFNTGMMLRADAETQMKTLATAVANFIYSPDEARAFLDMGSKSGGDLLYGNGNLIPITMAGEQYQRKGGKEAE